MPSRGPTVALRGSAWRAPGTSGPSPSCSAWPLGPDGARRMSRLRALGSSRACSRELPTTSAI
eukprot:3337247-Prorocentrum_lima.AAC.1